MSDDSDSVWAQVRDSVWDSLGPQARVVASAELAAHGLHAMDYDGHGRIGTVRENRLYFYYVARNKYILTGDEQALADMLGFTDAEAPEWVPDGYKCIGLPIRLWEAAGAPPLPDYGRRRK